MMGGPPTPGVGWASGIERVAMMLAEGNESPIQSPSFPLAMARQRWQRRSPRACAARATPSISASAAISPSG